MELKATTIVVGAGHAGVEAALASARMGIDTILTNDYNLISQVIK